MRGLVRNLAHHSANGIGERPPSLNRWLIEVSVREITDSVQHIVPLHSHNLVMFGGGGVATPGAAPGAWGSPMHRQTRRSGWRWRVLYRGWPGQTVPSAWMSAPHSQQPSFPCNSSVQTLHSVKSAMRDGWGMRRWSKRVVLECGTGKRCPLSGCNPHLPCCVCCNS